MTNLVKGYGEIHMFLEHPVDEPIEMEVEDVEPFEFRDPGEVDLADAQALEVINNAVDDEFVVYDMISQTLVKMLMMTTEMLRMSRLDFSQFGGHDDVEFDNVDQGEPLDVDAEQVLSKRAGKEPVVEDQQ
nr:hypothetical protein CFP56_10802 [Quercus suber]